MKRDAVAPRWGDYVLRSGDEFAEFWRDLLAERNRDILFVLGLGFDSRMCEAAGAILAQGGSGIRRCLLVTYDEGPASPSHQYSDLVGDNERRLSALMQGGLIVTRKRLSLWSDDGRWVGGRRASELINSRADLNGVSDVVVDISALPRSLYFPLIATLLHLVDTTPVEPSPAAGINVHVVVTEDAEHDRQIQEEEIDENAGYMHGFSTDLELEATAGVPRVWIPLLGEGKEAQLARIYDQVRPDEVCPVLPSPSVDPRRGDSLLMAYRELLFDRIRVEPGNILYASERNPFEVYRQVLRTVESYDEALRVLGGCKAVVSAVSCQASSSRLAGYWLPMNSSSEDTRSASHMSLPTGTASRRPTAGLIAPSTSPSGWQGSATMHDWSLDAPSPAPTCVGTGLLALDVVINGDPDAPQRLWAGGSCANVLTILSFFGWHAVPVARLGKDPAGEALLADLSDFSVDSSLIQLDEKVQTPIIIERITKDRTGVPSHRFSWACPQCGQWLPRYRPIRLEQARRGVSKLPEMHAFYFDRVSPGALELARAARERGALVLFEPPKAKQDPKFQEAVDLCHILKYSHEGIGEDGPPTPRASVLVIETLGVDGLRYRFRETGRRSPAWRHLPAVQNSTFRDAAGSGDWCSAGLLHVLGSQGSLGVVEADERRIVESLRFAQALSALNCSFDGARGGMYALTKRDFESAIRDLMTPSADMGNVADRLEDPTSDLFSGICPGCRRLERDRGSAPYRVRLGPDGDWRVAGTSRTSTVRAAK